MAMKKADIAASIDADKRDIVAPTLSAPLKVSGPSRAFRMSDQEWGRLCGLLARKGLGPSSGIRMILTEWMERTEREGLR
jgi:hypothetical protein